MLARLSEKVCAMVSRCRIQCESNVYHITSRGVGQQLLFKDDLDRTFLWRSLRDGAREANALVYAWCFMGNHIHLVVRADLRNLSQLMRKMLSGYAAYYNRRHDHVGHVFEGRFGSVPVQTDEQLLATVRYVHENPVDMGIDELKSYMWSSYPEYLGRSVVTATKFILDLLGGVQAFEDFHREPHDESNVARELPRKSCVLLSDSDAIALACALTGCDEPTQIASAEKAVRDAWIVLLRENGLSIKQIARITGIGRNIVQRARRPD